MKYCVVLLVCLAVCIGCTKIDYIGEEYPPTTHVDMFFSMDDIEVEYKVMGELLVTADESVSSEKMQKDMMKKAKEKGADAIVIHGLERIPTGETSTQTTVSESKGKKDKSRTTSKVSYEEKKRITATLIKYK